MIRDHMVLASFNTKTKKLKISSFQNIASCDIITLWNSDRADCDCQKPTDIQEKTRGTE